MYHKNVFCDSVFICTKLSALDLVKQVLAMGCVWLDAVTTSRVCEDRLDTWSVNNDRVIRIRTMAALASRLYFLRLTFTKGIYRCPLLWQKNCFTTVEKQIKASRCRTIGFHDCHWQQCVCSSNAGLKSSRDIISFGMYVQNSSIPTLWLHIHRLCDLVILEKLDLVVFPSRYLFDWHWSFIIIWYTYYYV